VTDNEAEWRPGRVRLTTLKRKSLGQVTTLDWIVSPVEAAASLAKKGIPTRINAPGTVMGETDQLLNSAVDKYYLVDDEQRWDTSGGPGNYVRLPDNRLFLDQIQEGPIDLRGHGVGLDRQGVSEKAFSKCWQDCMDTPSCDFVKYNSSSADPTTTFGHSDHLYAPGHCTQYKIADASNIGEARYIVRDSRGQVETDTSLLAINRDSDDASWGDRTHSMDIMQYSAWQIGEDRTTAALYSRGLKADSSTSIVTVDAPEFDTDTMKSTQGHTNPLLIDRTWNVSGVYIQQDSADFDLETPGSESLLDYTNIDGDSMSRGTSSRGLPARQVDGGLEVRFGTQNYTYAGGGTPAYSPDNRPYWKKTGGPGTPDLFLFYANYNTWLISTKLTCLWDKDAANNGIVPVNNYISATDGFIVASVRGSDRAANAQSDWPLLATGWTNYLSQSAPSSTATITTTGQLLNYANDRPKFNDVSPTQDEIDATISGASLTPEQEAAQRRDKIGNRRRNIILSILGLEEASWPDTQAASVFQGLPFEEGPDAPADNEKWISMNK